jgi:hypothetical protein
VLALFLAAAVGVSGAPACSTSTTNPEGASCDEAGQDCMACCTDVKGGIAASAYTEMAQRCACGASAKVCLTECAAVCDTTQEVSYECISCLRLGGGNCVNYQCYSNECKDFRACVLTCK